MIVCSYKQRGSYYLPRIDRESRLHLADANGLPHNGPTLDIKLISCGQIPKDRSAQVRTGPERVLRKAVVGQGEDHKGVLRHGELSTRQDPEDGQTLGAVHRALVLVLAAVRHPVYIFRFRNVQEHGHSQHDISGGGEYFFRGVSELRDRVA